MGKFQYFSSFRGQGAKPKDIGEYLRKYTKIRMKNSNKFIFIRENSNIFVLNGSGAKSPDVGEYLLKYTKITMKNSKNYILLVKIPIFFCNNSGIK